MSEGEGDSEGGSAVQQLPQGGDGVDGGGSTPGGCRPNSRGDLSQINREVQTGNSGQGGIGGTRVPEETLWGRAIGRWKSMFEVRCQLLKFANIKSKLLQALGLNHRGCWR